MNKAPISTDEIKETVKGYVMSEFLPGEDPDELTDTTPLVSGGILNSMATVKLVAFIEEKYGLEFDPREIRKHLDSLKDIGNVVSKKIGEKARPPS